MKRTWLIILVFMMLYSGMTALAEDLLTTQLQDEYMSLKMKYTSPDLTAEEKAMILQRLEKLATQWQELQPPPFIKQPVPFPVPFNETKEVPPLNTIVPVGNPVQNEYMSLKMKYVSPDITAEEKAMILQRLEELAPQLQALQPPPFIIQPVPFPVPFNETKEAPPLNTIVPVGNPVQNEYRALKMKYTSPAITAEEKAMILQRLEELAPQLQALQPPPFIMQPMPITLNESIVNTQTNKESLQLKTEGKVQAQNLITPLRNATQSVAEEKNNSIVTVSGKKIYVNKKLISLRMEPVMMKGTMMVPAKSFLESMDYKVSWNAKTKVMQAVHKSGSKLNVSSSKLVITDKRKNSITQIDAPIVKGTKMVSLRILTKQMGYQLIRKN